MVCTDILSAHWGDHLPSYLSNQWVGNFFGYLQSLNATLFYHSVWVLGGLTFGLLSRFAAWIGLGRMRISMNLFYRDMLLVQVMRAVIFTVICHAHRTI